MFDVFVSYNRADTHEAQDLAACLSDAGLKLWFDTVHLQPGSSWRDSIEADMKSSGACIVLWGKSGLGPFQRKESGLAYAIQEESPDFHVINVVLPTAKAPVATLSNIEHWVQFKSGFDESETLQVLVAAIKGHAPPNKFDPTLPDSPAPYRGLAPFGIEDTPFFHGRSNTLDTMVEKLRHTAFLAVIGASGMGKTSLVQSGLEPRLRAGVIAGGADRLISVVRPAASPLRSLCLEMARMEPGTDPMAVLDSRSEALGLEPGRVCEMLDAALPTSRRLLIIIDRLEELFTLTAIRQDGQRFVDAIAALIALRSDRVWVVSTMRVEFYPDLSAYSTLDELVSQHQIFLSRVGPEEVEELIEAPAMQVGAIFERGLAHQISLDAQQDQEVSLPPLQLALDLLWRNRRGRWLTWEAYRKMGGVSGALLYHAGGTILALKPEQVEEARRLLCRMVWVGDAPGQRATRRIDTRNLVDGSPAGVALSALIRHFQDNRLLIVSSEGETSTIELIHDTLTTEWRWLSDAIEHDREFLAWRQTLDGRIGEWRTTSRDPASLLRGALLTRALERSRQRPEDLTQLEQDFIQQSREHCQDEADFLAWHARLANLGGRWEGLSRSQKALLTPDSEILSNVKRWIPERSGELAPLENQYINASLAAILRSEWSHLLGSRYSMQKGLASQLNSLHIEFVNRQESLKVRAAAHLSKLERRGRRKRLTVIASVALTLVLIVWSVWEFGFTRTFNYQVSKIRSAAHVCLDHKSKCESTGWMNVLYLLGERDQAIKAVRNSSLEERVPLLASLSQLGAEVPKSLYLEALDTAVKGRQDTRPTVDDVGPQLDTIIKLAGQLKSAGLDDVSMRAWDEAGKSWEHLRGFEALKYADKARVSKVKAEAVWKDALSFVIQGPKAGEFSQTIDAFENLMGRQVLPLPGAVDRGRALRAQLIFPLIPHVVDVEPALKILNGLKPSYGKTYAQACLAYGLARHTRDAEALELLKTLPDSFSMNPGNLPPTDSDGQAPEVSECITDVFQQLAARGHVSEMSSLAYRLPADSEIRRAAEEGLKSSTTRTSLDDAFAPPPIALRDLAEGKALARAHRYRDARLLAETSPEVVRWQIFEAILNELSEGRR